MSAEPVLGIFSFFASDTYKENEKLMHAAFESRSWKGLQRIYEGTSVDEEDLNRRWLILVWDTHEEQKSFMDDSVALPTVLENLGICTPGEVEMCHARFSDTTVMALTSPTTEIAKLQLKDITQKSRFEEHMHHFIQHAHVAPRAKKHSPFVFGETLESSSSYIFIGGWDSKQDHLDCVVDPEGIKYEVEKIGDYTTFKVHHFRVREHQLEKC